MQNIFKNLSDVFAKDKIHVVLVGGFALHAYQICRHTMDLDFMLTEEAFSIILPGLQKIGYQEACRTETFVRLSKPGEMDLDFLFTDPDTLTEIEKNAKKVQVGGSEFFVPSAQHLIAMKLHAVHQQPRERGDQDITDILSLVKVCGMDVRSEAFKASCLKQGSQEIYDKILQRGPSWEKN